MITIRHNHEDGTLVYGTRKGDGVFEIIKKWENGGFRFFPSLRMLGLRNSRDQVADRYAINAAAKALREAGYEVEIEIDDSFRDRAQVLEDKADRLEDRRDALENKAGRHAGAASAAHDRAHQISERFAAGQPILVGHHSEGRARADRKRMDQAMRKSIAENDTAQEVARRANAVGSQMRRSATPAVTARRIKTAESELRKIQKSLDGYTRRHLDHKGQPYYIEVHEGATGDHREMLLARKAQLENQLEYDRAQLAAAVEAGEYVQWGKHNVHVGDVVHYWGIRARPVVKVNTVTVAVESDYSWPDKVRYTEIRAVECPHGQDGPTVTAPKRPAKQAQAKPKAEVPTIDTDKLKAAAQTVSHMHVGADREAFVSPPAVVARLMELAEIEPGMTVLEPSAGTGNIALAAVELGAVVDCVELDNNLVEVLASRVPGTNLLYRHDFLETDASQLGTYDRIVMNPPFSGGKDIAHVTHALDFLKPGGRLVAVMGGGVAFHKVKAAAEFRQLVEDRGGSITALPADAFKSAGITVTTVIVTIPC
ncbi:DUF3560 domain-containing protein [Nonomuraea cavernae]|uniref:Ribosomal RNA adenine methylase transferase N-terminal domain-containing protein n=1 Tax=Nonomuraea cavernae TaxID=2045107 RepID=A0A917YPC2_9ACTN|nr:DUF3560 domain-containing protein [Nonomuraea cavernae]MCA2184717.1 DUF3560 domain-containing protein [Nonomuraea cavernae]GGO62971.1 hypothetical protein GCM10012289_08790 [Nonomuraea cavernae]